MRAVICATTGDASLLQIVERPATEPADEPAPHHVVNYRDADAADQIRRVAPAGVDVIVEVGQALSLARSRCPSRTLAP